MFKNFRIQLAGILLVSSIACYTLGLVLPLLQTQTRALGLTLKSNNVRLFDSIMLFWNSNEFSLAVIIFLFTIVLPIIKYVELLLRFLNVNFAKKYSAWLKALDKWSMLDVFIVALLLLNFKLNSSIMVMRLMDGTTFLAVSILLRMAAVHAVQLARQNLQE